MSKEIDCFFCEGGRVSVEDDYEMKFCCSGLREQCGCMGLPINPVFCDECEKEFFGKQEEE